MSTFDIVIIIIYVVAMFGVGVYARTRIKSVDDYLVAGNRFNTFSLVGTLMAALIGAGMTMGMVGGVYKYGSGILWNWIGFAFGLVIFAVFYMKRLRSSGKRTMAEVIAGEFGRLPRFFVGIFAAVYAFGSVSLCITGMGRLISYLGEGIGISVTTGVIITALITVVYTALGGFYSVVWTDVVQFVIMIIVVLIIGPIIVFSHVGSFTDLNAPFIAQGLDLLSITKGVPITYIVASFVLLCISVPGDPTVPQRALAGSSTKIAKRSFLITAVLTILFGIGLVIIGAGAFILFPDLAKNPDEVAAGVVAYGTAEAAFPVFIMKYFPTGIAGLGIAALLAAIMSTISAMLLVGTTHLVYDAGRSIFPKLTDKTLNKALPISILLVGVIVTFAALMITSLAGAMYFIFSLCGAAFLFPMLFTLYWKKASKWGITTGIVSGGVLIIVMYIVGWMGPGGDPVYLGMIVSLLCCIVVSLVVPGGREDNSKMLSADADVAVKRKQ